MTRLTNMTSPWLRGSVGFDGIFDELERTFSNPSGYPPYNIVQLDNDKYEVVVAVAGFSENEIDVSIDNGVLSVNGSVSQKKTKNSENKKFLYKGIGTREFNLKFNLADHVKVKSADMGNGLLTIKMKRELPESMKPRKIEINDHLK